MTRFQPFFLLLAFILPFSGRGQLTVVQGSAMNLTPQELIQNYLIGAGITVSNVTFNGSSAMITSNQVGTFATAGQATMQLGLSGGILMTSGKANIAIGPNNAGNAGYQVMGPGDPDLNILSASTTYDKAVFEFDFIPQSDTVRFRYVFGSEEFFEYCNQFNDAFGFFLSGPGITGTFSNNSVNIARMPGSLNNYVTINNICASASASWNNAGGQYYQYDGLTHVFTAWYTVEPCQTYHIKLAIGDAVDKQYDSGVFLEQNSFSSPGVNMTNNSTIPQLGNVAVESCNDVAVNFRLAARMSYPYTVNYIVGGTATNGTDYTHIDDFVTFPAGSDSVDVIIHPISDGLTEGQEMVILTINQVSCDGVVKRDTIYIDDYVPMTIVPNPDTALCFGGSVTLEATTTGGIMPLAYQWNIPGNDSLVTLVPPVGTNIYSVKVTDVCSHIVGDTATVTVHPVPVAHAGNNTTIANGTSTTLHGTASGGYGNYGYAWTSNPPGFTSNQPEPSTGNMSQSRIFILTVTDLQSGCVSLPSQVVVSISGGPLSINPVALPDAVCLGDTVRIMALSGGGSGLYTYSWTSTPPGFTASIPDPLVTPTETTTYHLAVNDGFNQVNGSTLVTVWPLPLIHLGPADTLVCIYDTLFLDAGNPGSSYKWSDGTTNRFLTASTTGIGFDQQVYSVEVTNENGCSSTASIIVVFSFDGCVGIRDHGNSSGFSLIPNPAHGTVRLRSATPDKMTISLLSVTGCPMPVVVRENGDARGAYLDFDVSLLPAGLYFVKITGERTSGTLKLIVN